MPVQIFYKPGKAPNAQEKEPKELGLFLERELGAIADSFAEHYYIKYQVLYVAPERPREGMTVYADGSSWNPGHGKGVYVWSGTAWLPQSGQAAAFVAHKNGVSQTGLANGVYTQITFGSEEFDIGGYFASSAWTPPAGSIYLSARLHIQGATTIGAGYGICGIYKNGTVLHQSAMPLGNGFGAATVSFITRANGTDVYSVWGNIALTAGTGTVLGDLVNTGFSGVWLGP